MATHRFEIRKDKLDKEGKSPIRLIYQVKTCRKFFPTSIKCFPINWDSQTQQCKFIDKKTHKALRLIIPYEQMPLSSEVDQMNNKLNELRKSLIDVITVFGIEKKTCTPSSVIAELKAKTIPEADIDKPNEYIADFIDKFIKETTEHKEGTIKEYKSLANHIRQFEKIKREKFTFTSDASILNSFSVFLSNDQRLDEVTVRKKVNNITRAKLISTFKTILRHAKKPPYKITSNPDFLEYVVKRRDSDFEVIALTEQELQAVIDLDLSNNKALDEARDIFLFACSTSLRYSDLAQIRHDHIRKDGTIQMTSVKGSKKITVPLTPLSYSIINKYKDTKRPLPVQELTGRLISSQKLNKHIQTIGEKAKINTRIEKVRHYGTKVEKVIYKKYELLSIHVGRKTFITLSLAKGMPIQEAMSISTHSSFKAVKRYIDVTKEKKKEAMAKAWGEVKTNNLKIA